MKNTYVNFLGKITVSLVVVTCVLAMSDIDGAHAAVTARGGNARVSVGRAPVSVGRMPTMTTSAPAADTTATTEPEPAPAPAEPDITQELADVVIENKASQFDDVLSDTSASNVDAAGADLAEKIRRQRAALDAQSATAAAGATAGGDGANTCDQGLRTCMKEKCGKDYTGCAKDGDTLWGTKMDACRTTTKCTANEYAVLSVEIKADRDMNVKLGSYNAILECGNSYNACIEQQCGAKLTKCLGKKNMDTAVAACDKIAKGCVQQDGGLAGRVMEVVATLRQDAEKQVKADEQRLYDLRDKMAAQCRTLGAAFDDRSFDCVFTVNFFANNSSTPYATRRAYAGNTFSCTQDWFGVDVTTFKENAMRLTREQTSESMGKMGDGLGAAIGMATSGVISRGVDRYKAEKAVKDAKKQETKEEVEKKNTGEGQGEVDEPAKSQTRGGNTGNAGEPGNTNGNAGEPGNTNGNTGEPGNTNGNTGEPGNTNGNTGEPGNTNGNTGEPGNTNGNTGNVNVEVPDLQITPTPAAK